MRKTLLLTATGIAAMALSTAAAAQNTAAPTAPNMRTMTPE